MPDVTDEMVRLWLRDVVGRRVMSLAGAGLLSSTMHAMARGWCGDSGLFGTRMITSVPGSCCWLGGIVCEGTRRFVIVVWADVNAVVAWGVVMGPLGACLRLEDRVIVHKCNEISWRGVALQTTALEVCVV